MVIRVKQSADTQIYSSCLVNMYTVWKSWREASHTKWNHLIDPNAACQAVRVQTSLEDDQLSICVQVIFVHPNYLPGPQVPGLPPFAADFLLDTVRAATLFVRPLSRPLRHHCMIGI